MIWSNFTCPLNVQSSLISSSRNLKLRTLHLGITPNLETLSLHNNNDMVELQTAECRKLVNLEHINLKLKTPYFLNTPNLETLRPNNCTDMLELHIAAEYPELVTLDLNNVMLRTLDLGLTPNLQWLYLKNCYDLEEINAPAECLKKLLYLYISHCGRFESFEFDKKLDSPEVVSLSELHLIEDDTWSEFQFSCYYKEDPASSFGNLERLISLGFGARINVDSFSDIICGLQCLRKLTLEGSFPEALKNLDRLDCLEELSLRFTDIKTLPNSICMLKHLKSLELESCLFLEKLPDDLGQLKSLEELMLQKCRVLQDIPNSICEMKRLEYFYLSNCILVEMLPEEIGRLECLKRLDIEGTSIRHLPQSIFRLKGLCISGSTEILESCGLTSEVQTYGNETFCYI